MENPDFGAEYLDTDEAFGGRRYGTWTWWCDEAGGPICTYSYP